MIVQKKTREEVDEEKYSGVMNSYNVFMAMVEKVGHDRRGNTLFKRDENGEEIWEYSNVLEMNQGAEGNVIYTHQLPNRMIDDQSSKVPPIFRQWKRQEGIAW